MNVLLYSFDITAGHVCNELRASLELFAHVVRARACPKLSLDLTPH